MADNTGLDISPSASRFFHKRFVLGSATAKPFPDGDFDAVWSIWSLEHTPAPEQALREIRRVVKPGGHLFVMPTWRVMPWMRDGLTVRPYSELGHADKLRKALIGPRNYAHLAAYLLIVSQGIQPGRSMAERRRFTTAG